MSELVSQPDLGPLLNTTFDEKLGCLGESSS